MCVFVNSYVLVFRKHMLMRLERGPCLLRSSEESLCVSTSSWIMLSNKGRRSKSNNPHRPVSGYAAPCVAISLQGPGWGPRDRGARHTGSENLSRRGHTSTPISPVKPSPMTARDGQSYPGPGRQGPSAATGSPAGPITLLPGLARPCSQAFLRMNSQMS